MKKLIILTGAGISAESGIKTFRDSDGLWENHNVMDVATPEAWEKNPQLVTDFYNERRIQLSKSKPNRAHLILKELEKKFDVKIITQNVDDLHERANSKNIYHLHGELNKMRSSVDENLIYKTTKLEYSLEDKCEKGSVLRPHIVWFGEAVPMIDTAIDICKEADILVIIGTGLNVYPAAGLVNYIKDNTPIYIIDPAEVNISNMPNITHIKNKATIGCEKLMEILNK
ncbi:MAG: NAD-dependent deacylase [Marinifilaceae bacterium]|jgi:NAD-dependent deacetylase|nr:NAD-dependent deacylase [Marinifilaceae bacterium]